MTQTPQTQTPETQNPGTQAPDVEAIVERYFAAFAVSDAQRPAALNELFADGGYYCDPRTEATDMGARLTMASELQQAFPDATISRSSAIDHHHRQLRFNWVMTDPGGNQLADGIDVLFFNSDEKVTHAFGFFGHAPAELVPGSRC